MDCQIEDAQKFELANTVLKSSKSILFENQGGITSNKRLLVIKGGHLYYYSNVPKFFKGDVKVLQNIHELPKCSIDIVNINKVKDVDTKSNQFIIQFEAKHMMQRQDIRMTLTNQDYNFTPKNIKQMTIWKFTCDNKSIKSKWINTLTKLKQYYTNQQEKIIKYFESINGNNKSFEKEELNGSFISKVPWRESVVSRKSLVNDNKLGTTSPQFLTNLNQPNTRNHVTEKVSFSKIKKAERRFTCQDIVYMQNEQPSKEFIEDPFLQGQSIQKLEFISKDDFKSKNEAEFSKLIEQLIKKSPNRKKKSSQKYSKISISQKSNFYQSFTQIFNNQQSLPLLIDKQKSFLIKSNQFRSRVQIFLQDYIQSNESRSNCYKSLFEDENIKIIQSEQLLVKIAFPFLTNSQSSSINISQQSIKNIKRQFKVYQQILSLIAKQMKINPKCKLRVPLCMYIQYRGICCIAFENSKKQLEMKQPKYQQWKEQIELLKQAKQDLSNFIFKSISESKLLVVYLDIHEQFQYYSRQKCMSLRQKLKKIINVTRQQKNLTLNFQSPIDKYYLELASESNASTSITSFQKYIEGLQGINVLGICPKSQIVNALASCIYIKQLRKIYRFCKGKLNQTYFINLILQNNPIITDLTQMYTNQPIKNNIYASFLSFIEHYFAVEMEIENSNIDEYKRQNKDMRKLVVQNSISIPIVKQYSFSFLQIYEQIMKFNFYLEVDTKSAQQTLNIKKELVTRLVTITPKFNLQIIHNQSVLYLHKKQYQKCIEQCKKYIQNCHPLSTRLIPILIVLMQVESKLSQKEFSKGFKKLVDLIDANYGANHSCLISIYCMAGEYYELIGANEQIAKQNNLIQIGIKFVKKAQQLAIKYFEINSKQNFQINLKLAKLYLNLNYNTSLHYIEVAQKILNNNQSLAIAQNSITLLIFQAQFYKRFKEEVKCQQQIKNCLGLANQLNQSIQYDTLKRFYKTIFQFALQFHRQKYLQLALQSIWNSHLLDKLEVIQMCHKALKKQKNICETVKTSPKYISLCQKFNLVQLIEVEKQKEQKNIYLILRNCFISDASLLRPLLQNICHSI